MENKHTKLHNSDLLLITNTKNKCHANIYTCHSARAGPLRLRTLDIQKHAILQSTYRGLFVDWLYDKLFVIKRDVSYFTPWKTNLGCQPSKRKSSH